MLTNPDLSGISFDKLPPEEKEFHESYRRIFHNAKFLDPRQVTICPECRKPCRIDSMRLLAAPRNHSGGLMLDYAWFMHMTVMQLAKCTHSWHIIREICSTCFHVLSHSISHNEKKVMAL